MTDETTSTSTDEHNPPQSSGGFSPALLIVIMTAGLGMLAAVAMLAANADNGNNSITNADAPAVRSLRDWQADDFTLTSLAGEEVSLSDYAGRPVFLNFWAEWCEPCRREFPAFAAFMAEQPADGPIILAVNQGDSVEVAQGFLDEIGVTGVPVLLDSDLELANDYPARNLPATYIIDPDGFVRFAKYGEVTVEELYTYLDELEPASRG